MRLLLAFGMLLLQSLAWSAEPVRLALPDQMLSVEVAIDGESPDAAWNAFVDDFFAYFDRNDNRAIDAAEFKTILPLPVAKSKAVEFAAVDRNRDGRLVRAELADWMRAQHFTPVAAYTEAANEIDMQLEKIFERDLSRTLRTYDLNDDETIELKELVGERVSHSVENTRVIFAEKKLTPEPWKLELELGSRSAVAHEGAARFKFNLTPGKSPPRFQLTEPNDAWLLTGYLRRDVPNVKSSADFLFAQFVDATESTSALTKEKVLAAPELSSFSELLQFADRNQDDRLTEEELRNYLALIAAGIEAQIVLTLHDHGGNRFPLLDHNNDQRLSAAELAADTSSSSKVFTLHVGSVFVPKWGGVRLPAAKVVKTTIAKGSAPNWFTAQDRNSDGQLSSREFLGPPKIFAHFDSDKDGVISIQEAE